MTESDTRHRTLSQGEPTEKQAILCDRNAWYIGEMNRDHVADGQGEMRFSDGLVYRGAFRRGAAHGDGEMWRGEEHYRGSFVRGRFHRSGSYESPHYRYEGEWEEGREHGLGLSLECRNALEVERRGRFVEGFFDGTGVEERRYTSPHERRTSTYTGTFVRGHRLGRGRDVERRYDATSKLVYESTYEGEFVRDARHGQGHLRHTSPDGTVEYEGSFRDNLYEGRGTLRNASERFDGEFKRGEPSGKGTLTLADGRTIEGTFEGALASGECTLTLPNGDRFVSELHEPTNPRTYRFLLFGRSFKENVHSAVWHAVPAGMHSLSLLSLLPLCAPGARAEIDELPSPPDTRAETPHIAPPLAAHTPPTPSTLVE